MGSVWCGTVLAKTLGTIHNQQNVGQDGSAKCRKSDAIGDRRQVAT